VGRGGEPPSLINPPGGCRFHPRCPHAMPVCRQQFPPRTELGGGHWTNCFLYGTENKTDLTEISHVSSPGEQASLENSSSPEVMRNRRVLTMSTLTNKHPS